MVQSDALSRRPDYIPEEDTDNEDVTMLPKGLFINLIDTELQERIANSDKMDKDTSEALVSLLGKEKIEDWTMEKFNNRNILFFKGRNYIPINETLRKDITEQFHDHETAGHPGELETYNAIRQHHWWPGLQTFIKNYVKGCGTCQQFKINRQPSKPSFIPTERSPTTRPFAYCSMDFITDLPPSENYDSILVVVYQGLSKGVILIPCNKTITAEETAGPFLNNLYKRLGLPNKIISDQGPQFTSKAFIELLKLLGIKSALSTTFHPQTDGTTK